MSDSPNEKNTDHEAHKEYSEKDKDPKQQIDKDSICSECGKPIDWEDEDAGYQTLGDDCDFPVCGECAREIKEMEDAVEEYLRGQMDEEDFEHVHEHLA